MSRVLRYTVPVDDQAHYFDLPTYSAIVHVGSRDPRVVEFWMVNPDNPRAPRTSREFVVVGTGHTYPDHWVHVGSVITADGLLVWHLMEVPKR